MTDKPQTGNPASLAGQRAHTMPGQRVVNLLVRGLLRTPGLAPIVGGRLVTLYVVGRKSGRRYPVPVAYTAEGNDLLIGTSFGWGRNLRTGEPVAIRLKGKRRRADVQVSTQESEVVLAYAHMAEVNPTFAKFSNIHVSEDGQPDRHDLHLAWAGGARAIRLTPQ
jgi:deazaflavin-dependent oxidoreductase (nitroreductase family)